MKNVKYLLGLIICFLFGTTGVLAADFSTSMTSSLNPIVAGKEFTVTVKVNKVSNFCGTRGNFTYDSSKLTVVNSNGAGGFAATLGTKLVLDAANGANGSVNVATIKFKPTANFAVGESTTISLGSQEGVTCSGDILSGSGSSVTIKMSAPKSTNNFLKSLSVSEGKINFNKATTAYNITVDNKVDKLTLNAEQEDEKASITGTGAKTLKLYKNTFKVVVTSESGAKKTYTINVVRKDEAGNTSDPTVTTKPNVETPKPVVDNTLKSLEITGHKLDFKSDTLSYTIEVDNKVTDLDISALPASNEAEVKINKPETLVVGDNIITIDVTTPEGEVKTYTINVTRKVVAEALPENNDGVAKIYQVISYVMTPIAIIEAGGLWYLLRKKKFK